jgi:mRNA-degrading endonuclease toxin of MazEF toxin-antitoxin module
VKQGEIYLVDLGTGLGLEASGQQLVVVVSSDVVNVSFLPVTVALVIPAAGNPPPQVYRVLVSPTESGLSADVVIHCLQVRSLDQSRFPASPTGALSQTVIEDVKNALHAVFRV